MLENEHGWVKEEEEEEEEEEHETVHAETSNSGSPFRSYTTRGLAKKEHYGMRIHKLKESTRHTHTYTHRERERERER